MEFYEVIEKRRTIRMFKKGASEEQLRRIISAGAKAPSAGGRQPWEFIMIDDPKVIDQLAEIKYQLNRKILPQEGEGQREVEEKALNQKKWFRDASFVAVCSQAVRAHPSERQIKVNHNISSVWLCVENMSLAAVAEGLGSNIISFWGRQKEEAEKVLGLPEGYELLAMMKFGEPGEEGAPRRWRPESSILHRNRF